MEGSGHTESGLPQVTLGLVESGPGKWRSETSQRGQEVHVTDPTQPLAHDMVRDWVPLLGSDRLGQRVRNGPRRAGQGLLLRRVLPTRLATGNRLTILFLVMEPLGLHGSRGSLHGGLMN